MVNAGLSHCELKCESATVDLTSTQSFSLSFFSGKGKKGSIVSPTHLRGAADWVAAVFSAQIKTSKLRQRLKTTTSSLIFLPTQSASLSYSDVCHNTTAAAGSGPASTTPHLENSAERIHYPSTFTVINWNFVHSCFFFLFFFPHRKKRRLL